MFLTDVECGVQYKCFQPHPKDEVNLCSTRLWDYSFADYRAHPACWR